MPRTVLTGVTGKLGGAVLRSILEHDMLPPSEIVVSTSSDPSDVRWNTLKARGVTIRHGNYDDHDSLVNAFQGCSKLLLVSSSRINLDFNNAEHGSGRERHHFSAIHAARTAGVRHIYYTSLAFTTHSKAGVMRAHNRTEDYLHMLTDTTYTIIKEGLYNESWPLYFGHYSPRDDVRQAIVVAGDGQISWASIADLGLATAMILVDHSTNYAGLTVTLSSNISVSLEDIAQLVSRIKGGRISLLVVSREQYEQYYMRERGLDPAFVRWWSTTYDAIKKGDCQNQSTMLETLLQKKGRRAKPLEETIQEMVTGALN